MPAQQLVYRNSKRFPMDVPQRLVEPCYRAGENRPAPVERTLGHDLPVILDAQRILPDEQLRQLLDGGAHSLGAAFDYGFTPADNPAVGLHPNKEPTGRDEEGFYSANAHGRCFR